MSDKDFDISVRALMCPCGWVVAELPVNDDPIPEWAHKAAASHVMLRHRDLIGLVEKIMKAHLN